MTKDKKHIFKYDEEQYHEPSYYFNDDLNFLFILIFLEAFKNNKEELSFGEFFKGNYWDNADFCDEIFDTNDYYSIEDKVIEQALFMFEDLRMGNVIQVGVDNINNACEDYLIKMVKTGLEDVKINISNHFSVIEQLFFLLNQEKRLREEKLEKNPEMPIGDMFRDNSVFFTKEQRYFSALQPIIIELPEHIIIRVKYDDKNIDKLNKEIENYLIDFSNDKFFNQEYTYSGNKRLYFSQQIENFYKYINRLNLIGDTINIPFNIINESGFEAIKILSFLQIKGVIKISWSDDVSWKVQFLNLPITIQSLLGLNKEKEIKNEENEEEIKLNLSFYPATGILILKDQNNKEYKIKLQGQVQKEVMRVIFQNPKNTYTEWSLGDISDFLGPEDVNEIAVKNAIYQFNRKIKLEIPKIGDIFELNQYSCKLNPKYVNKN